MATASSPTWGVTTRRTVPTGRMRRTVVSGNKKRLWWEAERMIAEERNNTRPPSSASVDQIFGLPGACDFNMDDDRWETACQLSQDATDDFDWRIGQRSETHGAGPQTDHSTGQCSGTRLAVYLLGFTFDPFRNAVLCHKHRCFTALDLLILDTASVIDLCWTQSTDWHSFKKTQLFVCGHRPVVTSPQRGDLLMWKLSLREWSHNLLHSRSINDKGRSRTPIHCDIRLNLLEPFKIY